MVVDTWPPPSKYLRVRDTFHLRGELTDIELADLDDLTYIIRNVTGKMPTMLIVHGKPYPKEVHSLLERYCELRCRQNANAK